jgi:ribosomal protein S18 acetylase RimI-like enzyme
VPDRARLLGWLIVDIRELDRKDVDALRRFWEIGKAADDATRPYDFYVPWETALATYTQGRPGFRNVLLGAYDGAAMVGAGALTLPTLDNQHLAFGDIRVHPDHQRRGVGSALVREAEQVARAELRRTLVCEAYAPIGEDSAALRFARALGYAEALEDGMKIVDLVETEPTWAALEEEVAGRHEGYRLVGWQDSVPDELLAGFCRINEGFNEEAPSGDLELQAEAWDEQRVRDSERQNLAAGRHVLGVAAVAPAGEMAGLTEIVVNRYAPHRGFQSGTLVLPEHRGRALGLAMKLANHRAARTVFPDCRVLLTGNAGVNVAMNAVNDRLGYRATERCVEVQKDLG